MFDVSVNWATKLKMKILNYDVIILSRQVTTTLWRHLPGARGLSVRRRLKELARFGNFAVSSSSLLRTSPKFFFGNGTSVKFRARRCAHEKPFKISHHKSFPCCVCTKTFGARSQSFSLCRLIGAAGRRQISVSETSQHALEGCQDNAGRRSIVALGKVYNFLRSDGARGCPQQAAADLPTRSRLARCIRRAQTAAKGSASPVRSRDRSHKLH